MPYVACRDINADKNPHVKWNCSIHGCIERAVPANALPNTDKLFLFSLKTLNTRVFDAFVLFLFVWFCKIRNKRREQNHPFLENTWAFRSFRGMFFSSYIKMRP